MYHQIATSGMPAQSRAVLSFCLLFVIFAERCAICEEEDKKDRLLPIIKATVAWSGDERAPKDLPKVGLEWNTGSDRQRRFFLSSERREHDGREYLGSEVFDEDAGNAKIFEIWGRRVDSDGEPHIDLRITAKVPFTLKTEGDSSKFDFFEVDSRKPVEKRVFKPGKYHLLASKSIEKKEATPQ
jgi:hypothetical protein